MLSLSLLAQRRDVLLSLRFPAYMCQSPDENGGSVSGSAVGHRAQSGVSGQGGELNMSVVLI